MQVTVKGVNVQVTEALDTLTRQKLDKILKHLSTITSADIILKVEKQDHIAEGHVLFPDHEIC